MKEYRSIYRKFSVLKWFFSIAVLFSIGEYSNYTQPVDFKETVELLVSPEEFSSSQNSILFSEVIGSEKNKDFSHLEHKYLVLLSLNHTKLSRIFKNDQSFFISLYNKHKIINTSYNSSYNGKEDNFHFNFIG